MQKLSNIGEFGLIDFIKKIAYDSPGLIRGIGDDAAVLSGEGSQVLLLTTDMLVEDVHFTRKMNPRRIGHKALGTNISDIAAMGGLPTYAVISLGLPPSLSLDFVKTIYEGINRLAKKFKVGIVGGDTNRSSKMIISVTLLGKASKREVVYRKGARKGDGIFVTGALGGSLKNQKHLRFIPRIKESQYLIKNFHPTSMIDISDGLCADLGHILIESQLGAVIYEEKIPRNPKATLNNALYDGEDFELIFTLSKKEAALLQKIKTPFRFYPIGEIVGRKNCLWLIDRKARKVRLPLKGFTHF